MSYKPLYVHKSLKAFYSFIT